MYAVGSVLGRAVGRSNGRAIGREVGRSGAPGAARTLTKSVSPPPLLFELNYVDHWERVRLRLTKGFFFFFGFEFLSRLGG